MEIDKIGTAVQLINDRALLKEAIDELSTSERCDDTRIAVESWSETRREYVTICTLPLTDNIVQIFKDELSRVEEEIKSL